jgi:hypothetical protein
MPRRLPWTWIASSILVAAVEWGCISGEVAEPNRHCTQMGCVHGLGFQIDSSEDLRGRIVYEGTDQELFCGKTSSSGGAGLFRFLCTPAFDGKALRLHFLDTRTPPPSRLSLELIDTAGRAFRGVVAPEYNEFSPNGTGCSPQCRSGKTIAVHLSRSDGGADEITPRGWDRGP